MTKKQYRIRGEPFGLKTFNNGDIPSSALLACWGIVAAVFLISLLVRTLTLAQDTADSLSGSLIGTAAMMEESRFTRFDGETIRGSDVRAFVSDYLGDYYYSYNDRSEIVIYLIHKDGDDDLNATEYVNDRYLSSLKDASSEMFVSPATRWRGTIDRNANGVILSLTFSQK